MAYKWDFPTGYHRVNLRIRNWSLRYCGSADPDILLQAHHCAWPIRWFRGEFTDAKADLIDKAQTARSCPRYRKRCPACRSQGAASRHADSSRRPRRWETTASHKGAVDLLCAPHCDARIDFVLAFQMNVGVAEISVGRRRSPGTSWHSVQWQILTTVGSPTTTTRNPLHWQAAILFILPTPAERQSLAKSFAGCCDFDLYETSAQQGET
jgi:hypothetical protein